MNLMTCDRSAARTRANSDIKVSNCRPGLWRLPATVVLLLAVALMMSADTIAGQAEAPGYNLSDASTTAGPVFSPNGRLSFDMASFNEDKTRLNDGSILRSGRVGGRLEFLPSWTAAGNITFNEGEFGIDDAWVQCNHREFSVKAGQFKEPLGLEAQASLLNLPFMERALPFALCSFRKIGVGVSRFRPSYSLSVGLFNGRLDRDEGEAGYAVTGRATVARRIGEVGRVHLGLALTRRTADADSSGWKSVVISSVPETRVDGSRFLNTGRIEGVDYHVTTQVEAAVVWRCFGLTGEYWRTDVKRSVGLGEPIFHGAYLAADIVLFGQQRRYLENGATFGGVTSMNGHGALELAVRASWLDLNDIECGITGGEGHQYTLGINWYINRYVRWMTSFVVVDHDRFADGDGSLSGDDDFSLVQGRLQVSY